MSYAIEFVAEGVAHSAKGIYEKRGRELMVFHQENFASGECWEVGSVDVAGKLREPLQLECALARQVHLRVGMHRHIHRPA